MARTRLFRLLGDWLRVAAFCDRSGAPAAEALPLLRAQAASRRRVLQAAAGVGALAVSPLRAAPNANGANVAVVGAGLAGLQAATVLAGKRARPQGFDAGDRVGGRVWSVRGRASRTGGSRHETTRQVSGFRDVNGSPPGRASGQPLATGVQATPLLGRTHDPAGDSLCRSRATRRGCRALFGCPWDSQKGGASRRPTRI